MKRTFGHCHTLIAAVLLALTVVLAVGARDTFAQGQPAAESTKAATDGAATPKTEAHAALPAEVSDTIKRLLSVMEQAEQSVTRMKSIDDDIGRVRDDVERVITRTTEIADGLRPRLADVKSQIDKLGPPPGKEAPPEAPAVSAERTRLQAEATELDGAIRTLELTWVRARQTIDKITDLRLSLFTKSLMERMSSPLLPSLWSQVYEDLPQVSRLLSYIAYDWWNSLARQPFKVTVLMLAVVLLYAGLKLLARRLTARRQTTRPTAPTFFERAAAAAWIAPVSALPAIVSGLALYGGLDALGLLYYPSERISAALLRATVIFAGVAALVAAVLAPSDPGRRLVSLSDLTARRMTRILQAIAFVYAADLALTSIGRILYLPLSMSVMQSVLATLAIVGLLVMFLLTPFSPYAADGSQPAVDLARPRWLKVPLWLAIAVIMIALVLGYLALARFVSHQIVMTGVVGLVATLLFLAIRAFTRDPAEDTHPIGRMLEARFGLDPPRRQQLAKLTEAALTIALAIMTLPILMLQWGFSEADIRDWVKSAFFGFEIGQFKISLARILIGILLFTLLLFGTRVVQRWLRDSMLAPARIDAGIANSIDTAVGYAGIAVAALIAISYAGFDVTNLAIVAGALSVGIGFGLQSIVNNFVSGLILLIERPIKVGDWIVVGAHQGNVRRISVRSTEIETFDRASLILPNSELITGRVLNWTHRNSLGRVAVVIAARPDADPRQVCQLLVSCARSNTLVLDQPPPKAVLDTIDAAKLEFKLTVTLADISRGGDVQSDLKIAIVDAMRAAGIGFAPAPSAKPGGVADA